MSTLCITTCIFGHNLSLLQALTNSTPNLRQVPGLLQTLQKFGVQIVYAREMHDEEEVEPDAWKMPAMCQQVCGNGLTACAQHLHVVWLPCVR